MAQSVKRLTSAQVMISQSVSLNSALGPVLTARSLEPALNSVSPSLSLPLPHSSSVSLSLSLSTINKHSKFKKKNKKEKMESFSCILIGGSWHGNATHRQAN